MVCASFPFDLQMDHGVSRMLALTPHAPIKIQSDADFASQSVLEGWPGDGSQANPYTIESLDIDASGVNYAIDISDTNVHFEIASCSLHGATGVGVHLQSVSNFTLDNVSCYASPEGYELLYCESGIITDGEVAAGLIGAFVYYCTDFYFSNNNFTGCGLAVYGYSLPHWASHTIDSTNIANGKPIYYCKGSVGGTVPAWAGEIFLIDCRDMTVSGRDISGTSVGITLAYCYGIDLQQNRLSMLYSDIFMSFAENCNVSGNLCENSEYGIGLQDSGSGNTIFNNTCSNITESGIQASSINNDAIVLNYCYNCYCGIEITYSGDSVVSNNTCVDCIASGLRLYNCWRFEVADNDCSSASTGDGLSVDHCDDDKFLRNIARGNSGEGFFMINSNNCAIRLNNLSGNWYGLNIWTSHSTFIGHNVFSDNSNAGVNAFMCSGLVIFHNSFIGNTKQGMDDATNANEWDAGYPSGGNYWSDYAGTDLFSGPNQDLPGSDGIGDIEYSVDVNTYDDYPLMEGYDAPPVASFTVSPQSGNPDTHFQFDASGSNDEEDRASQFEFRWDWEGDGIWDTKWSTENMTAIHSYISLGTYTATLEVRDSGNKTNATTRAVSVVDLAPVTIIEINGTAGEDGWYISSVKVWLSASDDWTGVEATKYRINGGSWQTYGSEIVIGAERNSTIEYYSEDTNDNRENVKSIAVKIDTGPPVTNMTVNGVSIELSASDSVSGIDRTLYRIDGGSWREYSGNFTLTVPGTHTIEYYSIDVAGNAETVKNEQIEISGGSGGGIDWFTWIIVIMTIAILVSISIPSIFGMRRRAKESDAKAQIKDIGTAMAQLQDDSKMKPRNVETKETPKAGSK